MIYEDLPERLAIQSTQPDYVCVVCTKQGCCCTFDVQLQRVRELFTAGL